MTARTRPSRVPDQLHAARRPIAPRTRPRRARRRSRCWSPAATTSAPSARQPVRQHARVLVVLGQPLDVVVERVQAAGRDDARLPERAAHHLLPAPRLVDQLARAAQHRAHRRAEALGEVEPGGVEAAGVVARPERPRPPPRSSAGRRRGGCAGRARAPRRAPPGSPRAATRGRRPCSWSARPTRAASAACSGPRGRSAASTCARRVKMPPSPSSALIMQPGLLGRAAGLGDDRVGGAVEDQLVAAGPGVQPEGDLVAHRAAGQEEARLVARAARPRAPGGCTWWGPASAARRPPRRRRSPGACPRSGGSACRCRG